MSKLTSQDILHIAKLARLEIPASNLEAMSKQFNDILGYVEKLSELKTDGIEPTSQIISNTGILGTPFQKDVPGPSFTKEEVVQNAPDKQDQFFKVPRMIGDE